MKNKYIFYILILVVGLSSWVFGFNVKKEIQDVVGYMNQLLFSTNSMIDGQVNLKISGSGGYSTNNRGYIYMSGDLWVGRGGGNSLFANGTNGYVGIGGTAPLSKLHITDAIYNSSNIYVGGNIGVGTTSPNHKLDVRGNIYTSNYGLVEQGILVGNGIATPNRDIHVYRSLGNNAEINIQSVGGANKHYSLYHDRGSDQFRIRGNGRNSIAVYKNGNVSIGNNYVTDPTAPLDVAGDLKLGTSGVGCNSTNIGKTRTVGTDMEYCNGSARIKLNLPVCPEGQYFRMIGGKWGCFDIYRTWSTCLGSIVQYSHSNASPTSWTQTRDNSQRGPFYTWHYSTTPGYCTYQCNYNYNWMGTYCKPAERVVSCGGSIIANAQSNGTATTRTQTRNGSDRAPYINRNYGGYNFNGLKCGYTCKYNYNWNGSSCVPATQYAGCGGGIPGNAYATTAGGYTQTRNGSGRSPYLNWSYGAGTCGFQCHGGYQWNGRSCIPQCSNRGEDRKDGYRYAHVYGLPQPDTCDGNPNSTFNCGPRDDRDCRDRRAYYNRYLIVNIAEGENVHCRKNNGGACY